MTESNYIAIQPDAAFERLRKFAGNDQPEGLNGFYASLVDLISAGNRGRALTWTLNGLGYSTNTQALSQAYKNNPEAIDNYLDHVNLDKLGRAITADSEAGPWYDNPLFWGGAAAGALSFWAVKKIL